MNSLMCICNKEGNILKTDQLFLALRSNNAIGIMLNQSQRELFNTYVTKVGVDVV